MVVETSFDLIIVGAGINGTGIARDAAMRGLKVLLLDKTDIAAGTTSWSSRLIHGGLRYLEHAEIPLVRESLRERERLLRLAPHLVEPQPLTIPIYERNSRGRWMIRAGMVAYDLLSFDKSLPRHRMMTSEQALAHEPGLNPESLTGAARYFDAQVEFPERLAVENAISAAQHGATIVTGAEVSDLIIEAGVVRGVVWEDCETAGAREARAPVTMNVAGPWVDRVLAKAGLGELPRMIGGTKGSHLVVDPFPGAPSDALYVEASRDGRPYFVIPWNDLYLIGTTDIRYDGNLDRIVPEEDEIQYLLDETNLIIPAADLGRDDVLYAYAGLRPLPYQPEGKESAISRRHIVRSHAPKVEGLLSVIGGKLTTYRSLAEQAVDAVYEKMGRPAPSSPTRNTRFPGADGDIDEVQRRLSDGTHSWLDFQSADYLLSIYGTRAEEVVVLAEAGDSALRTVVDPETGLIGGAVLFALEQEHARTLVDIVMRRTMIGYARIAGFDGVVPIAEMLAGLGVWSESRAQAELDAFYAYMTRFLPKAQQGRSAVLAGH